VTGPPKNGTAPGSGENNGAGGNDSLIAGNSTPLVQVTQFLNLIIQPGAAFEVRAPKCRNKPGQRSGFWGTVVGYFTHATIADAAQQILALDAAGVAPGIYITLNPVQAELLARSADALQSGADHAVEDTQILHRIWALVDCDPVRAKGISSTDKELEASRLRAEQVRLRLTSLGWPDPVIVMSGNGYHLLYAIELPADDEGLVNRVLKAISARFSDGAVVIDTSVGNAARITKVAGTMVRKGTNAVGIDGMEDRPHRRACIVSIPNSIVRVPRALLESVAAELPAAAPRDKGSPGAKVDRRPEAKPSSRYQFERFDHTPEGVRGYLFKFGINVTGEKRDGSRTYLFLDRCPVVVDCTAEGKSDIAVTVDDDGVIGYKNLHNRGTGLGWLDVREALEAGYIAFAQARGATSGTDWDTEVSVVVNDPWNTPLPVHGRVCEFPINDAFPAGTESVRDLCVEIAEAYQVPVDLPAMLVPPVIGLSLSHKVRVRLGPEWLQPPNHYHACLMEPGNRKTGPFQVLTGPIEEWEKLEAERLGPMIAADNARVDVMRRKLERLKDLASGKGRAKSTEPSGYEAERAAIELEKKLGAERPVFAPQLITSDVTTEELARLMSVNGERIGVMSDEGEAIEVFLGRYDGKPNVQLYNKGYDGSMHRMNRVNRLPVILHRPLISIGFVIQPEAVRDMLTNQKAKGTGLVSRFGMSLPLSLLGSRSIDAPALSPTLRGRWRAGLLDLLGLELDAARGPVEVVLSAKAQNAFREFQLRIEPELSWMGEFAQHGIQDWGGKFCGRIGRYALTLHGIRHLCGAGSLSDSISEDTMLAAIAWAPYLLNHAKAVMGWLGSTAHTAGAKRILAWIARDSVKSFSKQECFTKVRNASIEVATDVDGPLSLLSDLGYLRDIPSSRATGSGRKPSPRFVVNPKWDGRPL
jgi:replicative DNA helicase